MRKNSTVLASAGLTAAVVASVVLIPGAEAGKAPSYAEALTEGVRVSAGERGVGMFERLNTYGAEVNAGAAVRRPAPNGQNWIVAPTKNGGVCVSIPGRDVGFCARDQRELDTGSAYASIYAPDTLVETKPGPGNSTLNVVKPSTKPGVRFGIAPQGATAVEIAAADGSRQRAEVVGGLYEIEAPAQGDEVSVSFR